MPAERIERRLAATREFFAGRARGWEERFPDDGPAFEAAVGELGVRPGQIVVDAGCGTGRALGPLRAAVASGGLVVAVDATPEMLAEAVRRGRRQEAALVMGDAAQLPLATASVDAVFAAGLLAHLGDVTDGLRELARVTRIAGRLAVFHPIGRVALAARHGRAPTEDDALHPSNLASMLDASGWVVDRIDDGEERCLALASRSERGVSRSSLRG